MKLQNFKARAHFRFRITSAMIFLVLVYPSFIASCFAEGNWKDGQSLLFLGDESAYLNRIDSMRNEQGLYRDRRSDSDTVSTAATGLGVLALAEASSRGLRDLETTKNIVRSAFRQTVASNPERNRGWLSHFTDANGIPKKSSEVSTIDTAIFYAGLLQAARLVGEVELENEIRQSVQRIDTQFVMRNGIFLHGFCWDDVDQSDRAASSEASRAEPSQPQFLPYMWNDSSEGVILYHLFGLPFPMQITRTDYPLFVYAYPLCFYDNPEYDRFLQLAIEQQIARLGYWGVTATDGPEGYVTVDTNVISPVLIGGISTKYPQYLEPLKALRIEAAKGAMHLPTGWTSNDDLTIDLSSAYILFSRWSRQDATLQKAKNSARENPPSDKGKYVSVEARAS